MKGLDLDFQKNFIKFFNILKKIKSKISKNFKVIRLTFKHAGINKKKLLIFRSSNTGKAISI